MAIVFQFLVVFLAVLVGAHAFWVGKAALGSMAFLAAALIVVGYFMSKGDQS